MKLILETENTKTYHIEVLEPPYSSFVKVFFDNNSKANELLNNEFNILNNTNLKCTLKPTEIKIFQNKPAIFFDYNNFSTLSNFDNISIFDKLQIFLKTTKNLLEIHKENIIHKNIRTNNIIIDEFNNIKILGFEYASYKNSNDNKNNPINPYISPEQTGRISKNIDFRSDLYSLGVVFYEILTNKIPFIGNDDLELISLILSKQADEPYNICNEKSILTKNLSNIILKLLSKNQEERYQSSLGLLQDLEFCLINFYNQDSLINFDLGKYDWIENFQLSKKIFGREKELSFLLETIQNKQEHLKLFFISGKAGVGKTFLINELNKLLKNERFLVYFGGKYEQFNKSEPYYFFINVINNFISNILTKTSDEVEKWKNSILSYVGSYAQVLIDLIPNLELVIGKQPEVTSLGNLEDKNRFNYIFTSFIQAISQKDNPLIIFVDDLQWIDNASIKIIQLLIESDDTKNLIIIGTHRKKEKSININLFNLLEILKDKSTIANFIEIENLDKNTLSSLIKDSLKYYAENIEVLIDLIFEKTQGNPFFVNQLLSSLYEDNLLFFSHDEKLWKWNYEKIKVIKVSDNVVELLVNKLKNIPVEILKVLQFSACLGNIFNTKMLEIISDKDFNYINNILLKAINLGLICNLDNSYEFSDDLNKKNIIKEFDSENKNNLFFQFLHDQILQAVYSTIDNEEVIKIHLLIARSLLKKMSLEGTSQINLFELANHFNKAKKNIIDKNEKESIAKINLETALKAKKANAYEEVLFFAKEGLSYLNKNDWEENYNIIFELFILQVESELLNGNTEEAEKLYNFILERCKDDFDKNRIYYLQLTHYSQQLRYPEAIEITLKNLKLLGFNAPRNNFLRVILTIYLMIKLKIKLKNKNMDYLYNLPNIKDEKSFLLTNLIASALDIVYASGEKQLLGLIIIKSINIAVKQGNSEMVTLCYAFYANMLQLAFYDYKKAKEFGELALKLANKYNNPILKCKILTAKAVFLSHFYEHISFSIVDFEEATNLVIDNGNPIYATYDLYYSCLYKFIFGENLTSLFTYITNIIDFLNSINIIARASILKFLLIPIQSFSGDELIKDLESLEKNFIEENKNSKVLIGNFYYIKIKTFYFNEEYEKAFNIIENNQYLLKITPSILIEADTFFYLGLVLIKFINKLKKQKNKFYLSKIKEIIDKFKKWSNLCPDNYLHKYSLLKAEYCFYTDDIYSAEKFYQDAVNSAYKYNYNSIYALASKLTGQFYISRNLNKIALIYIKDAYEAFLKWGAKNLAKKLVDKYEDFYLEYSNELSSNENLDFLSLIKSSQAISSEINLEKLVEKLMYLVKENAAAEKAVLVLFENSQWYVKALAEKEITYTHKKVEECNCISKSVFNYVLRTEKLVLIDNASNENDFIQDAYILDSKVKSLLCIPIINKGSIIGILYMENNLTIGAFTEEHINILNVLSGQIAISLENARLYELTKKHNLELEQKVEERTANLRDINELQKGMIQTIVHDLKNPLSNIIMFSRHLEIKTLSEERVKKTAKLINNSSNHMAKMVENLLEITKIEEGVISPEFEEFDLIFMLKDVILSFLEKAKQKNIELIEEFDNFEALINADKTRTKQVLENIISNALKFSPEDKKIYIKAFISNNNIVIEVKDEGPGLTDLDKSLLFKKFSKLSAKPTAGEHTTGLGLSIVKKLMEVMNGEVWCESQVNEGASFFLSFNLISKN
ncbi:MAG: AAA family ATPase [Candidatus Sericytochromatia bacterium]